jgi:hypothetical protein
LEPVSIYIIAVARNLQKQKASSLIKKTAVHFGSRFFGRSRKIVARTLKSSNNNKLCIFACCPENLIPFLWTHYYPQDSVLTRVPFFKDFCDVAKVAIIQKII